MSKDIDTTSRSTASSADVISTMSGSGIAGSDYGTAVNRAGGIPGIANDQAMDGVEEGGFTGETLNPAWPMGGAGLGDLTDITTDVFTAEGEISEEAQTTQDLNASVRVGEEEMA